MEKSNSSCGLPARAGPGPCPGSPSCGSGSGAGALIAAKARLAAAGRDGRFARDWPAAERSLKCDNRRETRRYPSKCKWRGVKRRKKMGGEREENKQKDLPGVAEAGAAAPGRRGMREAKPRRRHTRGPAGRAVAASCSEQPPAAGAAPGEEEPGPGRTGPGEEERAAGGGYLRGSWWESGGERPEEEGERKGKSRSEREAMALHRDGSFRKPHSALIL